MMARIDEKLALVENFPWTRIQQNGIKYIDHKRDAAVKYRLMSELQRNDLDIAILHHHGDVEIEYMNDLPNRRLLKIRWRASSFICVKQCVMPVRRERILIRYSWY